MNTIQISIQANEEQQEILISQLSDLEAEGFEQLDDWLIVYFKEAVFKSYEVNEVLKGLSYSTLTIEEKNWNEVWESNFHPVIVDKFCGIRAEFHEPIGDIEHEIIITPKMSFGTGHHATTHMMIRQMQDLDFKNKTVFDFGTGTGILAILAEKLGASAVVAIDVDDWSITNTKENISRNGCSNISVDLSSQIPQGKGFDLILANINRNVILDYLPQLRNGLKENSYILLSGLLTSDKKDIVEACENEKLKLITYNERNNWISLLFIRTESTNSF